MLPFFPQHTLTEVVVDRFVVTRNFLTAFCPGKLDVCILGSPATMSPQCRCMFVYNKYMRYNAQVVDQLRCVCQ